MAAERTRTIGIDCGWLSKWNKLSQYTSHTGAETYMKQEKWSYETGAGEQGFHDSKVKQKLNKGLKQR